MGNKGQDSPIMPVPYVTQRYNKIKFIKLIFIWDFRDY